MSSVVLDNEAVQVLAQPRHPKHQRLIMMIDGHSRIARLRKDKSHRWVPTAVRTEAGWDRSDPKAASINRFEIRDMPLDTAQANAAARLVALYGVSPADSHIGASVAALAVRQPAIVLTSDPEDIALVCPPGTRVIRI